MSSWTEGYCSRVILQSWDIELYHGFGRLSAAHLKRWKQISFRIKWWHRSIASVPDLVMAQNVWLFALGLSCWVVCVLTDGEWWILSASLTRNTEINRLSNSNQHNLHLEIFLCARMCKLRMIKCLLKSIKWRLLAEVFTRFKSPLPIGIVLVNEWKCSVVFAVVFLVCFVASWNTYDITARCFLVYKLKANAFHLINLQTFTRSELQTLNIFKNILTWRLRVPCPFSRCTWDCTISLLRFLRPEVPTSSLRRWLLRTASLLWWTRSFRETTKDEGRPVEEEEEEEEQEEEG